MLVIGIIWIYGNYNCRLWWYWCYWKVQAELICSQLTVPTTYIVQSHCTALLVHHSAMTRHYKSTTQIQRGKSMQVLYTHVIFTCSYPDPSLGLLMRSTQCVTVSVFCQHFPQSNFDFVGVNGPFTKNPGLDHWCIRVPRRQASPLAKRIARPNVTSGGRKFGGQDLKMMT